MIQYHSDSENQQQKIDYKPKHNDQFQINDSINLGRREEYPSLLNNQDESKEQKVFKIQNNKQIKKNRQTQLDCPPNPNPTRLRKQSIFSSQSDQIVDKQYHQNASSKISSSSSEWENQTNQCPINHKLNLQKSSKQYLFEQPHQEVFATAAFKQISSQNKQDDDDMMVDIGKSFYTSKPISAIRMPGNGLNFGNKHQEELKQMPEKKYCEKYENQQKVYNLDQSVYMASGVQFKSMGTRIFWEYQKQEIEIEKDVFEILFEQFLQSKSLLPLISDQQYQMDLDIRIRFFQKYTLLLNSLYNQLFPNILFKIIRNRKGPDDLRSNRSNTDHSSSFGNILQQFFSNTICFSKDSQYKIKMLKNHLLKKLKTLRQYGTSNHLICKQESRQNQSQAILCEKDFKKFVSKIQDQIADLQILISFENSQRYCKTKSQKIQQKIWKERLKEVLQLKKSWINIRNKPNKNMSKQLIFTL